MQRYNQLYVPQNQVAQTVDRRTAELIAQQRHGSIVGIEGASDEDLQKLITSEFALRR